MTAQPRSIVIRLFGILTILASAGSISYAINLQGGGPDAFWARFVAEIPNGDPQALMQLVRKFPEDATWALPRQAQIFSVNNNPELGDKIEKLIKAWKDAKGNNFFDKYYEDIRGWDQGQWNEYHRATARWNSLLALDPKRKNRELDDAALAKFTNEANEVGGIFETLGDKYLAATSFFWAGASLDPEHRKTGFDVARAIEYYEKTIKLREQVDLKDEFYNDIVRLVEKLKIDLKKGGPAKPKDPKDKPSGDNLNPTSSGELFAKNSTWVSAAAKFSMVLPDEIERPGWNTDGNYIDWLATSIEGKPGPKVGGSLSFFSFKDAKFIREENAKYIFDPDGKSPVSLKALGKMTPFEVKLPTANGPVDYALVATIGSNQESFRTTSINYSPQDTRATIMYTSAASRTVDLGGQKIRVFDDNCDAKFGSDVIDLVDYKGWMTGTIPFMDSMLVGSSKKVIPFSGFVKLGPKWYRFKSDSEQLGVKFQSRELDIKTGTLKGVWSGPAAAKPHYLIVKEVGEFTGAYFDLLSGGDKGLEVPAGEYEFVYGVFRSGKGRNQQKYAIVPPADKKKLTVKPGETVTLQLGAPFTFAHKTVMDSSEVSISGKSIEIRGAAGERYVLLTHEIPHPKLEWRKPGAKSGTGFGEMKVKELKSSEPQDLVCYPADFRSPRPDKGAVEIRIFEEHKWFGPIASEWIK
ncbi:MAG: hypothetical protein ACKVS6_07125 [Planctomycetota bacterium]